MQDYLSPEPLLQDPNWVKSEAQGGSSTPTYAYARNNPLKYTDPSGNNPAIIVAGVGIGVGEALVYAGVITAGAYCIGTQCLGNLHWPGSTTTTTTDVCTKIGPQTLEEQCNKISSDFVQQCRKECTQRTGNFVACAVACRAEGKAIRASCIAGGGGGG